jgi:glutathione synthase/RimK-type ligase-like ATP-grasp enzyme
MKVAILRDDRQDSSRRWEASCNKAGVEYSVINMLRSDWLDLIKSFAPEFCVSRPPDEIQQSKKNFDEKIYYLEHYTPYSVFPGFLETYIYENKASLTWFLKTNDIPHADTFISSAYDESILFVNNTDYPIVAKTLIGAAGSGVKIINSKSEAVAYVRRAFTSGIKRRFGPNRKTGTPKKWLLKAIDSPDYFFKKIRQYRERNNDSQKKVVLFQEYIPHPYEWRCVKIGESYFAYKKLKIANQASGSKIFEYGTPPVELLDFTKELCELHRFNFMALDLFHNDRGIFVNEMQTIFGHKNPYICKVNNQPGRYIFQNDQWVFEVGDFNTNESYDLRLQTAIDLYTNKCIIL